MRDEAIDVTCEVLPAESPKPRPVALLRPEDAPKCIICHMPAVDPRKWSRINTRAGKPRPVPLCPTCQFTGSALGHLLGLLREELAKQGYLVGLPKMR